MTDKIRIGDQWYVSVHAARAEEAPLVLKHDDTFAMFDRFGDMRVLATGEQGLYHEDTRHLSHLELLMDGVRPMYLRSAVREDNDIAAVDLMNPDLPRHGVPKGTVHLFRAKLLWEGACYERLRLTNHGDRPARFTLSVQFDADFADLFEVRGLRREQRGERLAPHVRPESVELPYRARDGRLLRTRVVFDPPPQQLTERQADFEIALAPKQELYLCCTVSCEHEAMQPRRAVAFTTAFREHESARQAMHRHICAIETSNPLMNRWLCRSVADLVMLTTRLPTGPYPYAGVPWYATTFGRDGLLTAWMSLWAAPELTRGVLAFLAETQAHEEDPANDAEPGKILHEARKCETARTGEVPFGRYYGTVDATPLFIGLAGAYLERSGDLQFVRRLWPHIERALEWIDRYGDADGDGFVEYRRRSEHGLVQQGWKDSHDSIFHADGRHAEAPIALCEVQGYVYQAKRAAARMAGALGDARRAEALDAQAETLRTRFQQAFWCEDLGLYALALDGDKRPCRVATSNAGHALWSGIAHPQHAARIAQRLLEPDFHSGWGIRTLAEGQPHYNPMSYHNGSVWPHDNALIALGMARYGHTQAATQVLTSLFEASLHFENHRLPELFCGFPRRPLEGPTLYPVACSPQAWASAAVFALVQACLGLDLQAATEEISFATPQLPPFIDWMRITDLAVQGRRAELLLKRYDHNVGIELGRKEGGLRVRVTI